MFRRHRLHRKASKELGFWVEQGLQPCVNLPKQIVIPTGVEGPGVCSGGRLGGNPPESRFGRTARRIAPGELKTEQFSPLPERWSGSAGDRVAVNGAEERASWGPSYGESASTRRKSPPKRSLDGPPSRAVGVCPYVGIAGAGRVPPTLRKKTRTMGHPQKPPPKRSLDGPPWRAVMSVIGWATRPGEANAS